MSPSRRCYFCGISTVHYGPRRRSRAPVRSYQLTDDFLSEHPFVMEYARHTFEEPQITAENKICRPCLQRADRFVIRQSRERMQEELSEAARQIATDVVVQPSSSSSSRGVIDDPLGGIDMPEEVIVPEVQNAPTQTRAPVFPVHDFKRVPFNSTFCIASGCNNQNDLHRIPLALRIDCLYKQNIYIPFGNRACSEHLMSNIWNNVEENSRSTIETFNSRQMSTMLKLLQKKYTKYLNFERLDSIDDYVLHFYTGYTKDNFLNILEQTPSITQTFKKPKTALATVICKLHTGDSNERLSSIFRMTSQHFGAIMKKVRYCLCSEFVPKNLGFDHINGPNRASSYRHELLERILRIPNVLFSNPRSPVITICDGTYFYIQKSSNYAFQRASYSTHKFRNLLKVFLIVSPDGYIIETFGPYEAKKSDASIMEDLISEREDNPFHWFFEAGDIFILDRGFRDVMERLEEVGYEAYMPLTKDNHEHQLTTPQANESRKVTLCRWVVETVNGRLKNQFKQLRSQYVNIAAPHLYEEVRISCALINAYGVRLTDNALVDEIINEIYLKYDAPNLLSEIVIQENFNMRRASFQAIDASEGFSQFPELSYDELIIKSLGPYQVAQARSYYGEHLKINGDFYIEVYEDDTIDYNLSQYGIIATSPWLLRSRIHSRHSNTRIYFVYILLDDALQGRNKIIGHYCTCLVGKRTLGCCSHVMTIIWYMAWARHQETIPNPPAGFLDHVIFRNIRDFND